MSHQGAALQPRGYKTLSKQSTLLQKTKYGEVLVDKHSSNLISYSTPVCVCHHFCLAAPWLLSLFQNNSPVKSLLNS
jgi:hypothetical protein